MSTFISFTQEQLNPLGNAAVLVYKAVEPCEPIDAPGQAYCCCSEDQSVPGRWAIRTFHAPGWHLVLYGQNEDGTRYTDDRYVRLWPLD